jgi:hypothetical protein
MSIFKKINAHLASGIAMINITDEGFFTIPNQSRYRGLQRLVNLFEKGLKRFGSKTDVNE